MEFNFKKIYLETTNICNLNCTFCHKTSRVHKTLTIEEFKYIIDKIKGKAKYLYFHLMGEPLLNSNIVEFLKYSFNNGFLNIITTNGTLLFDKGKEIIESGYLYKMNISIHSYDANNENIDIKEYLFNAFKITEYAKINNVKITYRLWNLENDIVNPFNSIVLDYMHEYFKEPWIESRNGYKLNSDDKNINNFYLEYGEKFDWPDINNSKDKQNGFCYGLRDQIGILVDGSVVPCCLDADGILTFGNIFKNELDDILNSDKVKRFYDSFSNKKLPSDLCKTCGYIKRFK